MREEHEGMENKSRGASREGTWIYMLRPELRYI